jgi:hypothetical protein
VVAYRISGDLGVGAAAQPLVDGLLSARRSQNCGRSTGDLGSDPGPGELSSEVSPAFSPVNSHGLGPLGVVVGPWAQQPADAVERVAGAAAVAGLLTFDTTADRVVHVHASTAATPNRVTRKASSTGTAPPSTVRSAVP